MKPVQASSQTPPSPLSDSEPPQEESLDPDRPAEPVGDPPQPIREVNLLVGSAYPAACSFQLLLAYPRSDSATITTTEQRAAKNGVLQPK